jgi:hypothetical protein
MYWLTVLWECATWFRRPRKTIYQQIQFRDIESVFRISVKIAALDKDATRRHLLFREIDEQYGVAPGTAQHYYCSIESEFLYSDR